MKSPRYVAYRAGIAHATDRWGRCAAYCGVPLYNFHKRVSLEPAAWGDGGCYTPPPDAPPLKDIVHGLTARAREVPRLDEAIMMQLRRVERSLAKRQLQRLVRARITAGVELAWSKGPRGRWRLVIRDEEGAVDLFNVEPEERLEVILSGALTRLIDEVLRGQT